MSDDKEVQLETSEAKVEALSATVWFHRDWAQLWFADAKEAAAQGGETPRRHEVVFCAIFAEAFLKEWVVGRLKDWNEAASWFDSTDPVDDGYRDWPKCFLNRGITKSKPNWDDDLLMKLREVIKYRHALVHSKGSEPERPNTEHKNKLSPQGPGIEALEPGWAVRVVRDAAIRLCEGSGVEAPAWLRDFNEELRESVRRKP